MDAQIVSPVPPGASTTGKPSSGAAPQPRPGLGARIGLGLLLLLGIAVLMTGLIADLWVVVVLWTIWIGLMAIAYLYRRTRPVLIAPALLIVLVGLWGAWKLGQ